MIVFVWLGLGILGLWLLSFGWSRLGERFRERDELGDAFAGKVRIQSTIDAQPLDIDPALHRVPSIYRRRAS